MLIDKKDRRVGIMLTLKISINQDLKISLNLLRQSHVI